jgi:hypothetical protein
MNTEIVTLFDIYIIFCFILFKKNTQSRIKNKQTVITS